MDKLKMHSGNMVDENIAKIGKLFPNCLTERKNENGEVAYAIDFDMLKQELSSVIVEGSEERYQFTWPDKKKSSLLAYAPTDKTLRPCRAESVDFDNTENLYIEGDNLEVLKLLRETYLGKVKMIYIDPPYNTGNDFIYNDDFAQSAEEYRAGSGQFDEEGNRLVQNTESNGRFHTDWLNMFYTRIKLARELLSQDGALFISIDDCELENAIKICNEVFNQRNFVANLIWKSKSGGANDSRFFAVDHEYILVYAKSAGDFRLNMDLEATVTTAYNRSDEHGEYALDRLDKQSIRYSAALDYEITGPDGTIYRPKHKDPDHPNATWRWSKKSVEEHYDELVFENGCVYTKNYKKQGAIPRSLLLEERFGRTRTGKTDCYALFGREYFSNPKPYKLIRYLEIIATDKDSIVMDFFSGSATTAHAVMQLNAEDGGNRKFILVQIPEETAETTEAYKAGYKNICEIGKERIRRAGARIKAENPLTARQLDTGFRVLKLDSSNMKDVYYNPAEYELSMFTDLADNIKEDRTSEDLLFQVMPELGILLSSKIEQSVIGGKKVFNVADGRLYACFDSDVSEAVITEIAKKKPDYFVMRDSSMADDSVAANFEQIFAVYSPATVRKVL